MLYTYPPMVDGNDVNWLLSAFRVVKLSRLPKNIYSMNACS